MFKMLNQEIIGGAQMVLNPEVYKEKPALAWIVKQAEEAYDFQKMAWENKYCDYHDCLLCEGF